MLVYWKTMQREKSKVKLYIPHVENTHVQFQIRLWLFDLLELIKLQPQKKRKKEKYRINKRETKTFQKRQLKVQQMTKKTSTKYRKNYTYKIRIQLSDWFTWTKRWNFILNWTENNKPNELTKIDNNGCVTRRRD